jgi:ABC-type glutathione transport system ATPase component
MKAFLTVEDLYVRFSKPGGTVINALNGISLQVREGTMLGVLGELGSGKSTLAKTLLRMLPRNAQWVSGTIEFEGINLRQLSKREMNKIRGDRIAIISQELGLALNPVMKVGDQIAEVLRAHREWDGRRCRSEAESLLERVNLRSSDAGRCRALPSDHENILKAVCVESGNCCQIAGQSFALACVERGDELLDGLICNLFDVF